MTNPVLTPDLIIAMLTVDPKKRITVPRIKSHSWCMTCVNCAQLVLTPDPPSSLVSSFLKPSRRVFVRRV